MNCFCLIVIILEVTSVVSGYKINLHDSESHDISKRSTSADHSITDVKSRHRARVQRQLLLNKLIRAVDTSAHSMPEEVESSLSTTDTTVTITSSTDTTKKERKGRRGRGKKSKRNRASKALRKSIEVLLESEYADDILEAIAKIAPKEASKVKNAASRLSKFGKRCTCTDQ